jgi:hypothetical protein
MLDRKQHERKECETEGSHRCSLYGTTLRSKTAHAEGNLAQQKHFVGFKRRERERERPAVQVSAKISDDIPHYMKYLNGGKVQICPARNGAQIHKYYTINPQKKCVQFSCR